MRSLRLIEGGLCVPPLRRFDIQPTPLRTDDPEEVTGAQERRAEEIIKAAAERAVLKIERKHGQCWQEWKRYIQGAVMRAVTQRCRMILEASAVSDQKRKVEKEVSQIRKDARSALARELHSAKKRLRKTRYDIAEAEKVLRVASHQYEEPPPASITPNCRGEGLPAVAGIYFVWYAGKVAYVGQSTNLSVRCRLKSHHAILEGDTLSFLPVPSGMLNFAEAYYIGTLMPPRNFGMRARR